MLIGTKNFDEIVELSKTGDNAKVDLLVKDIYGGDSPFANLQGDLLASRYPQNLRLKVLDVWLSPLRITTKTKCLMKTRTSGN